MARLQLHRLQQDGEASFEMIEASPVEPWAADEPLRVVGQRIRASKAPRRSPAERELQGRPLDEEAIGRAAEAALADARALSKNRYKIPLASGLIRQALRGPTQ